ncbi:hypothetical protein [Methylophaga sp.]|uniref:hypothetical protein n=1 Tax=Methylophaga sp. TaxID=2024840 RepID=UPI003A8E3C22
MSHHQQQATSTAQQNKACGAELPQKQVEQAKKDILKMIKSEFPNTPVTFAKIVAQAKGSDLKLWNEALSQMIKQDGLFVQVEKKMLGYTYRLKDPKPMTEAMMKVDQYRDQMNEGREKILADDHSSVVYQYDLHGSPIAIGYKGRAKKATFHVRFKSEDARSEYVHEWMSRHTKVEAEKKQAVRNLKVGDVLKSSWGWEQTNVDYYLVTKLIGKVSVEIVQIGKEIVETEYMQGRCVPDKNTVIGEPMKRRVDDVSVRIDSNSYARKKAPKIIAGCEVFDSDFWSSYA